MKRVVGVLTIGLLFVSCANTSRYKGATSYQKESYKTITRAKHNQMSQEPKVALVIGNRDYEQDSLRHPIKDAQKIKNFLESRGFTVIYDENVKTKGKLRTLVNRFTSSIQQDGVGVFYFSGHGMNAYNENYLIPTNNGEISDDRDVEDIGLSVNYLLKKLEDKQNRLNIVMLDACRNTLGKGASSALAGVNSAEGVYIAYATGAGKRAKDDGLFASAFVENAKIKGLTVEEVFKNVRREVKKATGQTPFAYTGIVGDFYFTLPSVKKPKVEPKIEVTTNSVPSHTNYSSSTSSTINFSPSLKKNNNNFNFKEYLNKLYEGKDSGLDNSPSVKQQVKELVMSGQLDDRNFWKIVEPNIIRENNNMVIFSYPKQINRRFRIQKNLFYKYKYLIGMILKSISMDSDSEKERKEWFELKMPFMSLGQMNKLYIILHDERKKLFILDLKINGKSDLVTYGKYKK